MKIQIAAPLCGLLAATGALAQVLNSEGPFNLRVKGKASNSTIDGYLYVSHIEGYTNARTILYYDPAGAPAVDDTSYHVYFNWSSTIPPGPPWLGFLVGEIDRENSNNSRNGRALVIEPNTVSNVAVPRFGADCDAVDLGGFDDEDHFYLTSLYDDTAVVANERPDLSVYHMYDNWAVCWQFWTSATQWSLAWINYGSEASNPTCEPVHLIKTKLSDSGKR
ncbi:hypothetical protein F4808DRAFT_262941 [Astrocystis sublimbata]|nr:hypothetical protein F4808DRAFT_262941 [Astrocystis sublimbata]